MKNVDKLKNQGSIGAEQKKKIDKNETSIPKMFLVLNIPFVDKISYHPSSPSFLTPSLLNHFFFQLQFLYSIL
ncbi:hypothetical protein ACK4CS_17370 [Enterococcus gallinarum]|uniref:Uncharacterized protein n=1 Tax=Enterococcus gallinarum TaxID=1353 RepID=A0AAE4KWS6_ENTGA|nr:MULTISPECIES: hypothetical protein [Enterococcus]MBM6740215.1 hypothetical protein [Enterococcus gallinarum]MCO5533297.1 hypothetical protein [Enterococcus faecium]MDT2688278.1 hypothetical protein [Enterococcus gallinarum]MDT2691384.1 hypothetical protein [Enterococcus gallinarum]QOG26680.1 hypothetical protein EGM181_05085 [Enterococcus gallinarum]